MSLRISLQEGLLLEARIQTEAVCVYVADLWNGIRIISFCPTIL